MNKKGMHASQSKKTAVLSLTAALALVSFMLENLLPSLPLPGAKIGLSNVFVLFALTLYGLRPALLVVTCKTVLGALFAGNPSLVLYAFPAGIASTLAGALFLKCVPKISVVCVSVLSAVAHNFTQLAVYCLITRTVLLFSYAPLLTLFAFIGGGAVGATVLTLFKALPQTALYALKPDEVLS